MSSVAEWKEAVLQLDDWKGCVDFIDEELVELWNSEKHMKLETAGGMLTACTNSQFARNQLLGNNLMFRSKAEEISLRRNQQKQQPTAVPGKNIYAAESANSLAAASGRPRSDFPLGKSYWSDLDHVFFLGQKTHMANAIFMTIPGSDEYEEYRGNVYTYEDLYKFAHPDGKCMQMCSNVLNVSKCVLKPISAHLHTFVVL